MLYPVLYNIQLSFRDVTAETLCEGKKGLVGFKNYLAVLSDPVKGSLASFSRARRPKYIALDTGTWIGLFKHRTIV
jgi:ABC-type sugar transport system permease subunit